MSARTGKFDAIENALLIGSHGGTPVWMTPNGPSSNAGSRPIRGTLRLSIRSMRSGPPSTVSPSLTDPRRFDDGCRRCGFSSCLGRVVLPRFSC